MGIKIIIFSALTILISSCQISRSEEILTCSYHEIDNLKILWNDVFSIPSNSYYVFFFTPICYSCKQVCREIIDFAIKNIDAVYFVESTKDVAIKNNHEGVIGVYQLNEFYIEGFPTLIQIVNSIVKSVFFGEKEIKKHIK